MSLPQRQIQAMQQPKIDRRTRGEFESAIAIIKLLVDEARDKDTAKYLLRGLKPQCKLLAERFDLRME